jgi:phenylacetic acid degradation operon negative regulatory protein
VIVTIFGDAVIPRGGELWLGSLTEIASALEIDPGAVRTALTRLAADHLITRTRVGRESFVRLDPRVTADFERATERIYFAHPTHWTGRWRMAVLRLPTGGADPRTVLAAAGFAPLGSNVMIAPQTPAGALVSGREQEPAGPLYLDAHGPVEEGRVLAGLAFRLDDLAMAYRRFLADFAPTAARLREMREIDPLTALVARVVVVHAFRRVVLRDPLLPLELLPDAWPGTSARRLAGEIYDAVRAPAEVWLDNARNAGGKLPKAVATLWRRFAD